MKISYALAEIIAVVLFDAATAADITVGGASSRWKIGVDYSKWASSQIFRVGYSLDFRYASGQQNVLEVTKANHDSCGTSNPISTSATGNDKVPLTELRTRYFICGFPGHCAAGMKLAVDVVAAEQGPNSPSPLVPPPPPPQPTFSSAGGLKDVAAAVVGLAIIAAVLLMLKYQVENCVTLMWSRVREEDLR